MIKAGLVYFCAFLLHNFIFFNTWPWILNGGSLCHRRRVIECQTRLSWYQSCLSVCRETLFVCPSLSTYPVWGPGQARDCSVPNTRADLAGDKYTSYYYHESSISQRKRIIQNSFSTFSKQVFGKILSLSIQFNEIAE